MDFNWKFIFVLVLAIIAAASGASQTKFEAGMQKILQKVLTGNVGSLPIPGVPSLRTLKLPPMHILYDGYTVDISELTVRGLEHLKIEKLTATTKQLTMSLTFNVPALEVRADMYHLQGKVFFLTINDRGPFKLNIHNLRARADLQFGAQGPNTVIKRLNIDYSIGQVQAHLGGSTGIVTTVFNGKVTKMLRQNKKVVISKAKTIVETSVNKLLRGFTPAQLIRVISAV